ncbi:propionyl-CoA synthetase [Nesterenkonia sp. AN1]|uniref:Propionyl-CoA synthetase n=1 Tax=Nesterenkonia aurantiaca TaxID=1436010 RepID=A0A4R7G4J2_9MICC|nr:MULTISPECIES: AMP-binding protein [Nesterenkonia]EXF24544.1 propionyl-CoA synthetase [Nesterenkonia sp. AN1]TDS86201.1 propionyl-CoA synthetase [Nesterenkonia aurantiaca]
MTGPSYRELHARSLAEREEFWLDAAAQIDWDRAPERALDDSAAPIYRWFPDARLNLSYNCLDRHVEAGRGDQAALIYDSAVTGTVHSYSYAELTAEVAQCAGMLTELGVGAGDRVIIYLPMIPQAPIAMLACARIGAVHSVVFGGFAAKELASRIDDASPDVLLTATGGIEPTRKVEYLPTVAEALRLATHQVRHVVVQEREGFVHGLQEFTADSADSASDQGSAASADRAAAWHDWAARSAQAQPAAPVTVRATDPLYVLYTSGTTGRPKGVVRDQGGTAVALSWSMQAIYDVGPGETMFTASDVGWVVGHSFIVYGPLLVGATTVLYEGKPVGTPDAGAFWRMIQQHRITALFTAPTALRAIRKIDPEAALVADYDISSLRHLYAAGERLDPVTQRWITEALRVPVIDNWWQTETGWPIAANPVGIEALAVKEGSATLPMAGYDVVILDATGEELPPGEEGNIALRLPMPPGTLPTLWGDDQRYIDSYLAAFPGFYATGDSGYLDPDGYLFVMGRTDDVINVAGHRLSAGSIEAVVASHPAVAECAVIGLQDELKGQRASGFVVLKSGRTDDPKMLQAELTALVRRDIGPVADFKTVAVVAALPKTRSGKILRKTMRQIADGEQARVPSTIEDASVLDDLIPVLRPRR